MELLQAVKIAASGMRAQSGRMRIIAENLANANSTARTPGGEPYRRRVATIDSRFDRELGAYVVSNGRFEVDRSNFGLRYEPGHPGADKAGYVKTSNVKPLVETMDLRQAQRSYEANLNVITASRRMLARTLDILKV